MLGKKKKKIQDKFHSDRNKLNAIAEQLAGQNPVVISRMNHNGKPVSISMGTRWHRYLINPEIITNSMTFKFSYNEKITVHFYANTLTGVINAQVFGRRNGHNVYYPPLNESVE